MKPVAQLVIVLTGASLHPIADWEYSLGLDTLRAVYRPQGKGAESCNGWAPQAECSAGAEGI